MLSLIARNTFRQVLRDHQFRGLTALVWELLLTAALVGFTRYQALNAERQQASQTARTRPVSTGGWRSRCVGCCPL